MYIYLSNKTKYISPCVCLYIYTQKKGRPGQMKNKLGENWNIGIPIIIFHDEPRLILIHQFNEE